ncbi:hypothetical protein AAK943_08985 [Emergencia timonensis]|uniref:hypothetical protein n=1 Tax=Emergencia timonensis TaxID=1776384 RepID=UPI00082AB70E|nr:hypothetical protein [Emergencia timonensis]WNX89145.1 hypothetical protein RVY71_02480 [Emergencia timonensis]
MVKHTGKNKLIVITMIICILLGGIALPATALAEETGTTNTNTIVPGPVAKRIRAYPNWSQTVYAPEGSKIRTCKITADSLYDLALRSYDVGADEFYIDVTSKDGDVHISDLKFDVTELPLGDRGKMNSFGILTDAGYFRLTGLGARKLFDEYRYRAVMMQIECKNFAENRYTITIKAEDLEGNVVTSFDFLEENATFTVVPKGGIANKPLTCRATSHDKEGSDFVCVSNEDGTVTFPVTDHDFYKVYYKKEFHQGEQCNYTLDVINDVGGSIDLEDTNLLSIHPEEGYYTQAIIVNGVSVAVTTRLNISEGDVIQVVFSKIGETVDLNPPATGNETQREKIKNGVQATKIDVNASYAKRGVKVTWRKSKGYRVDYYQVFRSKKRTTGYGTKAIYQTKSGKVNTYINTKSIKKGTRYYYKIRGVRSVDGKKIYTKWSNIANRKA